MVKSSLKDSFSSSLFSYRLKLLLLLLFVILLDQGTKSLALKFIPEISSSTFPYGGQRLFSWLGIDSCFVLTYNKGAAWSLFESSSGFLFAFRTALIFALGFYLYQAPRPKFGPFIALMLAGAFSNWLDQATRGYVVDMISFTFWGYSYPIFNVADSVICLSALGLLFAEFRKDQAEKR